MMNLTLEYNDKPLLKLNSRLVEAKHLSQAEVDVIKMLHLEKHVNQEHAKTEKDVVKLRMRAQIDTDIEFRLQAAWGFPLDVNFHRFWKFPQCSCPKFDNEDAYPTGYYVRSQGCPIHKTEEI